MAADPHLTLIFSAKDLASQAVGRLHKSLGRLTGAVGGLFGGIKRLVSSQLGLIGLGAGLLGIEETLRRAIGSALAFGVVTNRVSKITGLATEQASRLVAVFQKYGLDGDAAIRTIGMLEKNVGTFTATSKAASKFTAEFGFKLFDLKGHVKDANTLILQAADYFTNKHIPASKKALLEAKLFGRQWQSLVPILALGKKGIKNAADEAAKLGLVLNKQNMKELGTYHKAVLALGEAWGGFQLKIGLAVMPILTKLMGFVTTTVLPGIQSLAGWVNKHLVPAFSDKAGGLGKSFAEAGASVAKVVGPILHSLLPALGRVFALIFGSAASRGGGRGGVGRKAATGGLVGAIVNLIGVLWGNGDGALGGIVKLLGQAFKDYLLPVLEGVIHDLISFIDYAISALKLAADLIEKLTHLSSGATQAQPHGKGMGGLIGTTGGGNAQGGPLLPGLTYRVGENGEENIRMGRRGGWVSGGARLATAGGPTLVINTVWPPTATQMKSLVDEFDRYRYRTRYNGGSGNRQ